jgi:hypothetical protein
MRELYKNWYNNKGYTLSFVQSRWIERNWPAPRHDWKSSIGQPVVGRRIFCGRRPTPSLLLERSGCFHPTQKPRRSTHIPIIGEDKPTRINKYQQEPPWSDKRSIRTLWLWHIVVFWDTTTALLWAVRRTVLVQRSQSSLLSSSGRNTGC